MECDYKRITRYPYVELKLQPNQNLKVHDTLENAIKLMKYITFEHQMEANFFRPIFHYCLSSNSKTMKIINIKILRECLRFPAQPKVNGKLIYINRKPVLCRKTWEGWVSGQVSSSQLDVFKVGFWQAMWPYDPCTLDPIPPAYFPLYSSLNLQKITFSLFEMGVQFYFT